MPVQVAPSWLLSVAVIAALGVPVVVRVVPGTSTPGAVAVAVLLAILLGVSIVAHELGHCVAARVFGVRVLGVRLHVLGGVSQLAAAPSTPRAEAIIAAAGPAVSGLLSGAAFLVLARLPPATISWLLVALLAGANAVIAVVNLLPALPLDGGRVLRAAIWRVSGRRRAGTLAAAVGGLLLAAALAGWAVVMLVIGGRDQLLPAGIAVATALFVGLGAVDERRMARFDGPSRPTVGKPPAEPAAPPARRSLTTLPGRTTVRDAVRAAGDRAVLLVDDDGVQLGWLDIHTARAVMATDPDAASASVAQPLPAEAIVLAEDDPADVADRARRLQVPLLLVDERGVPIWQLLAATHSAPLPGDSRLAGETGLPGDPRLRHDRGRPGHPTAGEERS